MNSKQSMRRTLRKARKEHVAALPDTIRALLFKQPPRPLLELVPPGAIIGLYRATADEAPAASYAKYFFEAGHQIALPRVDIANKIIEFHAHSDPFEETDLELGTYGISQPILYGDVLTPDVVFVPLLGFTDSGERLGQGGGFYDRWLAAHPDTVTIGLAWDVQLMDDLPTEDHDMPLSAVVTPTRFYEPFNAR